MPPTSTGAGAAPEESGPRPGVEPQGETAAPKQVTELRGDVYQPDEEHKSPFIDEVIKKGVRYINYRNLKTLKELGSVSSLSLSLSPHSSLPVSLSLPL